jgi:hypothetical protein
MFGIGKKRTVRYYADGLYNLDGYLMRKRRQKNRSLTDKAAEIRNGLIKNYILPLWGDLDISELTAVSHLVERMPLLPIQGSVN